MQVTCVGNNLAKKHVWLSIETHFGIFCISSIKQKYLYTIMYECEKSPLTHELFKYWTIQFFSFKFVSYKCYV
jgi:hypothetical protein